MAKRIGMQIEKEGDVLLVPGRVWIEGALFEGTRRVAPGDEDYEQCLAEYEAGGWKISDETKAEMKEIIAKHRRGEL
jgi:hypothetical protein